MDAQQTIAHLNTLQQTPGYESLKYHTSFIPAPDGGSQVLMHLGLIMPNAKQLMQRYGGVLYADGTFGLVLQTFNGLLVTVVDGEGHNHLVTIFLTPGHSLEQ